MPHKIKIEVPGHYRTADGNIAVITRIDGNRARGHMLDSRDLTWWRPENGQHGLYPDDDLIERLDVGATENPTPPQPTPSTTSRAP